MLHALSRGDRVVWSALANGCHFQTSRAGHALGALQAVLHAAMAAAAVAKPVASAGDGDARQRRAMGNVQLSAPLQRHGDAPVPPKPAVASLVYPEL